MTGDITKVIFNIEGFAVLIHLFILVLCCIYLFYSFLMLRQVKILTKGLMTGASELFRILSYGHFLAILILTIIVLLNFM